MLTFLKLGLGVHLIGAMYVFTRNAPYTYKTLKRNSSLPLKIKFTTWLEVIGFAFKLGVCGLLADTILLFFPQIKIEEPIFENDCLICNRPFDSDRETENVCLDCRYQVQKALRAEELKNEA